MNIKKNSVYHYWSAVTSQQGEQYAHIIRFFLPEFVTSLLLYSVPIIVDTYFIGSLRSTNLYSTLGVTNTLIHFIVKAAEGFSVGTGILIGNHNGREDYKGVGNTVRDAFWLTLFIGLVIALCLYIGAPIIYTWYVPVELVPLGVPFLRLRAVGILCMFVFMAFIGFLRGIKNSRAPMKIFISGSLIFLLCDYLLIYGKCGFPAMGLQGSAVASIVQYLFMLIVVVGYILCNKKNHKYLVNLFTIIGDKNEIAHLVSISWPIMLDKMIMALAYIWLAWVMKPMGSCCVATFCLVKDLGCFALLPAIACSQVITCLVSNDLGKGNIDNVIPNIKKVIWIGSIFVLAILLTISMHPRFFMEYFDKTGEFIDMAVFVFPILSGLVFFDLLQLILSGALRGSGNVKTVVITRFIICIGYFFPVSYIIAYHIAIDSVTLKFMLIYSAFYLGNAFMSIVYIRKFCLDQWYIEPKGYLHDKGF